MEIIFGIYKKYWKKDQDQGAHTLATRVGARLPPGRAPYLVGPWSSSGLNSKSIYSLSGRKK